MPTAAEKVILDALELPAEVRISLVDQILECLNLPTQPAINLLWAEEAERRIAELDRSEVDLIPGEEVFDRIRRKYGK